MKSLATLSGSSGGGVFFHARVKKTDLSSSALTKIPRRGTRLNQLSSPLSSRSDIFNCFNGMAIVSCVSVPYVQFIPPFLSAWSNSESARAEPPGHVLASPQTTTLYALELCPVFL